MKETISKEDYIQLQGLYKLGQDAQGWQTHIEEAIAEITGEEKDDYGYYNWAGELIWGNRKVDEFLSAQNIEVKG
jgi:hypothetical protein